MKPLKIVVPKGRLNKKVLGLLNEVGLGIECDERNYIPRVEDPEIEIKIMKPQNIPQLVNVGSHDIGFTGLDWMLETQAEVEEILNLGFDPVSIVAAAPYYLTKEDLKKRRIVVATEYEAIARKYLDNEGFDYYLIRTFGATEVFPPDDADMIIDNMASGRTLEEHKLKIIDCLALSSTRMIGNKNSLRDPWKKNKTGELVTLMQAVLYAKDRVMLEMNVPGSQLDAIAHVLPCMRAPTIALLYNNEGYAVKVAVKKTEAAKLIPKLKSMGATDILEYAMRKVLI